MRNPPAGPRAALATLGAAAAIGCSDSSGTGTTGPGPTPGPVGSVTVGNNFFESAHNSSRPATDTVAVGETVTYHYDCAVHGEAMSGTVVVL
jgi:hypothetical protein